MATFEEMFKEHKPNRASWTTMQSHFDAILGERKPPKEEPKPEEEKETSLLDDAIELGKLGLTQGMMFPNLLGGLAAETAGNILQGLGDLQRNSLAGQYAPEVADLLQNLGEGATGVAETMANTGTLVPRISYNSDPTEDTPSKFINQTNSAYTGALGNVARFFHADKVADAYGNKANELRVKDEERPAPDFTLDYLLSGLPVDLGERAGSMAAIAPAMYALPESAVAGMLNPITREMITRGMYGAAKVFSQLAPNAVRYGLTSAPLEGIMEGGQTRENLLAQGYSDEEATKQSAITAVKNMALLLPTNTLEGLAMFSPLAGAGKLATAGQIGGRGLLNTAQESYEEFAQEGIQNAAEGKPYSYNPFNGAENQYEAAKHVAGPAALMGLIGGGVGAYRGRNTTDEQRENQQNWNRGSQENISNDDFETRAILQSTEKQSDNLRAWAKKISGGKMSDEVYNSIVRNAKANGIPIKIALAQATAESNGDQNVTSEAGAIGVMQLMPETAEGLGVDPYDQEQNIRGGMKYLKDMYDQFGDWNLALAAYNAGAGAVQKYGGIPNYSETQNYVAKINGFLDESPYYEGVGDKDIRSEGINYLGENGKGEGNTWQKQNDNVSLDGAQPDLLNAIDVLGKWFYDRTGKRLVVTAGTNGTHADGEHSHAAGWKVDVNDWDGESDGYLVTADGSKGSLTDEFIKFGQSIGLGMNWEGDHIDVALDGNQWADENGNALDTLQNFGGFNPRKTAKNQSSIQPSQQQQQPTTPKPLFDINREDDQAQDIFAQFAEEKYLNGLEKNNNDEVDFFSGMFDTDGKFQSTKENRDAIRQNFTDEFTAFAQNAMPKEQPTAQPKQAQSQQIQQTQPENSLLVNDNLRDVMINYLDSIDRNAPENSGFALEIEKAFNDGKQEKVKSMLESRGVSTTSQANPITQNKPPENILPTPQQQQTQSQAKLQSQTQKGKRSEEKQQKLIADASAPVNTGKTPKDNNNRIKQAKAIITLANENKVQIPKEDKADLYEGNLAVLQKWHDELSKRGLFNTAQPQVQAQQVEPQRQDNSAAILKAREAYDNRKNQPPKQEEQPPQPQAQPQKQTQVQPQAQILQQAQSPQQPQAQTPTQIQPQSQVQDTSEQSEIDKWLNENFEDFEGKQNQPQAQTNQQTQAQSQPQQQSQSQEQKKEERKQRELWETELADEEEEVVGNLDYARDQRYLEEEEDENTEWVQQERQRTQNLFGTPKPAKSETEEGNRNVSSLPPESPQPIEQSQSQSPKPETTEIKSESKTTSTALFKRNDEDFPDIPAGRKAIKDAPNGTKIHGKWVGLGVNSESQYIIQNGELQRLDENGYYDGKAVKLSPENIRKHFGQRSLSELELIYPEDKSYKEIQSEVNSKSKPKKQTNDVLHAKLKTDTHPFLKDWLDGKIKEAATKEGKQARAYLKRLAEQDLNDTALDNAEENLRRDRERFDERRRNANNPTAIAAFDARQKESEQSLKFGYPSEKYHELKQKISQMSDKELQAEATTRLERDFDRNASAQQEAVTAIEDLINRDEANKQSRKPQEEAEVKEKNWEKPLRKTAKGNWHAIIGNANSREGLQRLIREKFFGAPLTIQEDGSVVHEETGEILSGIVRNNRGHWQYGKYEDNTDNKPKAESEQETEPKVQDNSRKEYDKQLDDESERNAKIEKVLGDAKEEAYKILEADKYPAVKSFLDRNVQNAIRNHKIDTVEKAEDLAKRIIPTVKKFKDEGQFANGVLWELWRNKYGDPSRVERKNKAKFETVDKIIKQVEDSKLPLEKAYEDVKNFLETDRRKSKKATSEPLAENNPQSEKQPPKTIEEKHSQQDPEVDTTDTKINEAAKNPDTAKAFEQLGAKIENGKVTTPDVGTKEAVTKHIENERAFAWHGTPHDFDNFSTAYAKSGEGTQVHGWGLYFAADKEIAKRYQKMLANNTLENATVTINGKSYSVKNGDFSQNILSVRFGSAETSEQIALSSLYNNDFDKNAAEKDVTEYLENKRQWLKERQKEMALAPDSEGTKRFTEYGAMRAKTASDALQLVRSAKIDIKRKNPGRLFKVQIPSVSLMLDELGHFHEQPKAVQKGINEIEKELNISFGESDLGKDFYLRIVDAMNAAKRQERRAAASKVLNAHGIKGITYETKTDGRCYVVFDDEAIKILEKYSKQGKDVDTTIKNYVDPKDLTPQQQLLQDFGRKLGTRVIFFNNGDGRFHGQHSNGITYLNVVSNMPLGKVFWHESMHWLKANNPKLYQQLVKAVEITDEQRQAYLERTERNDLKNDAAIDEEIISDQFEDVAKRSGLLQSIAGKNRGLIQRVIQWLQDTMKKFIEHFRNPQGKLTTTQSQALADEFGKIAKDLVDPNGEQIFRYNRQTHNVELANGRDWDSSTEHSDNLGAFNLQPKYSIDASDNSNESTLQRIRNKVSAFFNPPPKSRNKRIKQFLEKLADIRIVAGHIKGAKLINVDEFHRLLHTRKAYDWENILPEIGGMLAKSLNIQDSEAMRNYVTDWLLTGAPNNNSAEAKTFQQAARNNPPMFEILQKIRDEFDEFNNLEPEERYAEGITDGDKALGEKLGYYKDNWREEFTDDLHPIERMFNQVVAKAEKTNPKLAEWLKESVNPYELARLVRGKGAVADILVGKVGSSPSKRINEIRATLAEAYPNVNFSNFKPITMILEEIGALKDKKRQRLFEAFCVAKLDKEMYEKMRSEPEKYKDITPFQSESDADATIAKYEKEFGQAQRDLVHYSNVLITMRYDAGLMSKSKYNDILSGWQNYIPTARVFEENEDYDFIDSLKQKTGSHRDIRTPIQKLIDNTNSLVKQAERNKVKCQVAQLARCGQFGQIIAVTENSKPNLDNTVLFYEHGKKCWLETPDLSVVRALNSIQSQKDGAWIVKAFNAAMSFFRSMLTNRNFDFAAGNVFRDSAAAYIHNKHLGYANPFMFFADVARIGFKGFWTKDSNWLEWQTFGGSQASFVSQDVDYVQRSISDITETSWESVKKHPLSFVLDKMQYIAEASETATRLTTYVRARDALAKQRADGKATIDDKRRAALTSRNATIDFSRAGTSTRKANRVFAFANAAVQDWALQAQTFSPAQIQKAINGNKQAQQQIFSAAVRLFLMGVIPTVLQFVLMHSDDEKEKQYKNLHDWEKETYWYLGDKIRIPKSMDIGVRLSSAIIDELLKTAVDKDPAEWKRFKRLILDAAPGLTATLATPAVEAWANYSFFRDAPIVPGKEQDLPGNLQYGHDTSWFAKIFGAETGFSPRKIDYMISGYLGFMGRFFSHLPNYVGRGSISRDELPIVRRFLYEPYKNPKIVKDYYEALDEQASLYSGYKLELQKDRKTKPPEDFDPKLYGRLKSAQKTMQNLSKREKQIEEDPKLSESQRKEKLRELELRRVEICERVFNKAR